MNVNCSIGNRVLLRLWTMVIRFDTVASVEQKMPSKVEFRVLAGRLIIRGAETPFLCIPRHF